MEGRYEMLSLSIDRGHLALSSNGVGNNLMQTLDSGAKLSGASNF